MMMPMRHLAQVAAAALVLGLACTSAWAAEFNLFLSCSGKLSAGGKSKAATLDLAMRDNNETALIQRSNVMPVGERLHHRQPNKRLRAGQENPAGPSCIAIIQRIAEIDFGTVICHGSAGRGNGHEKLPVSYDAFRAVYDRAAGNFLLKLAS